MNSPDHEHDGHAHHHGYHGSKADLAKRLARVEGQVRGIAKMIDDDRYCIDILDQVAAATRALQQVSLALLDDHLQHCVADAVAAGGDEAATKLDEASKAIARLVKS
jgi:CsoR family transcriptional regulator, copper-sensing transcriptional repressor